MNRRGKGDIYNLRRNIHRLEKGLIQQQPRRVFAEDYIYETVISLGQLQKSKEGDSHSLIWAEAVLQKYFSVCDHVGEIKKAYDQFHPHTEHGTAWYPYPARLRPAAKVDYDSLYQLALRRRSIRHFLNQPVEFEIVKQAMAIAALAPGACNRQSFQFLFYNQQDVVAALCAIPGGYNGFTAPSAMIVTGRYRGYFDERDANVPIIDASLAVMALLLALETLGLSSVCINWPMLPEQDQVLRRLIHLDDDEFVVMLIGIGYADPAGEIPFSAKRDVNTLLTHNERIINRHNVNAKIGI